MVKLVMLFKQPADETRFETYYVKNLALLEKMPGIRRQQANVVLGNPEGRSPYYRILEFYFDSYETLDEALRSQAGITAGAAVMAAMGDLVEIIFVDVLEESY